MLTIWTSAGSNQVDRIVGPALKSLQPIPEHRFVPIDQPAFPPQKGEVVLALGTQALDRLKKAGFVPKNRSLKSMRGTVIEFASGGVILMSWDPHLADTDASAPGEIAWDVRLADRYLRTGSLAPEVGNYQRVDDLSAVIEYVEWKYEETGKPVPVELDLETMGLYPWYDFKEIVSSSWTVAPGVADVVYHLGAKWTGPLEAQITWLLSSPKVHLWGANLKFDLVWIWVKWKIECSNFTMDHTIVGSLLDENRSNSLNTHAKQLTPLGGYDDLFNATYDKGHMELVPLEEEIQYAGGDTDAGYRVGQIMRHQLLQDPMLARFYVKLLHPAARAFEKIERRGVLVDQSKYAELRKELIGDEAKGSTGLIQKLELKAKSFLPGKIKAKYADNLSLTRPNLIRDYFFSPMGLNLKPQKTTAKTKQPSTAIDHLKLFMDHPKAGPMIETLRELRSAEKTLSTYVDGFLEHLRPDGRFHPTYMLYAGSMYDEKDDDAGTVTGRLAAKGPAIQTLPKHTAWAKKLRDCYPAPSGMLCFSCDFSQGELRITACWANERTMLEAYRRGLDLHALTAARVNDMSLEEFLALDEAVREPLRQGGKVGNFGLIYGMGAEGFMIYARDRYGVLMTLAEAEDFRADFFGLYSGLDGWHERQIKEAETTGMVRSPLGRVRHLPLIRSVNSEVRGKARRQAINSPIQATLSDMNLWAVGIWEQDYQPDISSDLFQITGTTHDEVYGYVADSSEGGDQLAHFVQVMENLPFSELEWKPQLGFPVDAKVGPSMAQLLKLRPRGAHGGEGRDLQADTG